MKMAFSAPTADDEQRRRLFDHLRPCGYEGVQLKPADYAGFLDQPEQFLATYPQLRGLVSGCIAYGKLDDAGQQHLRRSCQFAAAVGADLVIFCHGIPRAGLGRSDLETIACTLEELGAEAEQQGVRLTLHHHFNQPCMHRPDFDVFFEPSRPRPYGLTIDTAHLVKSGIDDIAGIIRDFRHAVCNFHMKDFAHGQFKVLGEGEIDFAPVFQAIRDIGYDGWISADEESGGDVVQGMNKCARFLSQATV
jgi:inosose dehydratase